MRSKIVQNAHIVFCSGFIQTCLICDGKEDLQPPLALKFWTLVLVSNPFAFQLHMKCTRQVVDLLRN